MPTFGAFLSGAKDILGDAASAISNPAGLAYSGVTNAINAHNAGDNILQTAQAVGGNDATDMVSKFVNAIPGGQFVMDLPNRSVDTVAQVAQNADRVGWMAAGSADKVDQGASLAAVFNTDTWNKAWNTFGQDGHVTLGQYLGNQGVDSNDPSLRYFDPFDAQASQVVRQNIKGSWGGDLLAGSTDLAAGFAMPIPGAGILKAARLSKVADLANVERITEAWNSADGVAGLKATPALDTAKTITLGGDTALSAESTVKSQAAQFRDSVASTDGITSQSAMLNHLAPWMEGATEQAKATLSSLLTQANLSHADPLMAQHVKGNIILASMGSAGAKAELTKMDPLIARQLQNVGRAPDEITLETRLMEARANPAADYDPGAILDAHFDIPGAQAEVDALKAKLAKDTQDAADARALAVEARAQVPSAYGTFDSERLAESRSLAKQNIAQIQAKIDALKPDVKGGERWVGAESKAVADGADAGALTDTARGVGNAQGRIQELQDQLTQAKADHDLLHQTPLKNPSYDEAVAAKADATEQAKAALQSRQSTEAELRVRQQDLSLRKQQMVALRPHVNAANDWLNDIDNLGTNGYVMTGRVTPSRLDQVKTAIRNTVGDDYLYQTSDANRNIIFRSIPNGPEILSAVGTPRARGGINLAEVASKGSRELAESLKRSKAFTGDEIRSASDALIGTPAGRRQNVVAQWESEMLTRIAQRNGLSLEDAQQLVKKSQSAYAKGRTYLASALQKADDAGESRALINGTDGEAVAFEGAALRSHLADTAPFIDPGVFEREIWNKQDRFRGRELLDNVDELNSRLQGIWKHAVLLRPGLGVRAMLDTELRAIALIGAGTQFANAANGIMRLKASRAAQGAALKGLEKIGLDTTPLPRVALDSMGHKAFSIDIGNGKTADFQAYRDASDMAAQRMAMSNGEGVSSSLLGATNKHLDRLALDRSEWVKYKASSDEWPVMYGQHAQTLLASPTVRQMLADHAKDGLEHDVPTMESYVRELFQNEEIRHEYQGIALEQGISKADYVGSLVNETRLMFPTPEVVNDLVSGKVSGKLASSWVEKNFPPESRFDIPGPSSVLNDRNLSFRLKSATDAFYRTVLDAPDFWMARHPVFVTQFKNGLKAEAASLLQRRIEQYGPDAEFSAKDIATLEARSRTAAMQTVKNSFMDTTRNTSAHHFVTRISPFFNAWEDAMSSWSKLLYDDPSRAFQLNGAWNSFGNVGQWTGSPLLIDGDGAPLKPGQQTTKGSYIALPGVFGTHLRINKDALNSIAQGEVWWLPGFGPTTQVATTFVLGDILPKPLVMDMVGTDNPVWSALLHSMFLGGEAPKAGAGDLGMSVVPAWMRNMYQDTFGTNMAANATYYANARYIEAQKNGTPFDSTKAIEDGRRQAQVAGIVRLISGGGLGMSGRAAVDGQFYVDQMHQLTALSPDQLKQMGYPDATAAFSAMFPEAANLDWSLSRNETGISATVNGQKAAIANSGLIDKYPKMGWFIVGADNVGGQFSQTAYNQQAGMTYGLTEQGRKRQSVDESLGTAVVSQGWDEYLKFTAGLTDAALAHGLSTSQVSQVKQLAVAQLGKQNPEWYRAYNQRQDKMKDFFNEADLLANGALKDRPDMGLYRDYRDARQQVMDAFGIQSLTGTSATSAQARAVLTQVGEKLSTQNIGFQQMWTRALSAEVNPLPTDKGKLVTG